MDWHLIVPGEGAFTQAELDRAYEVRLRCGRPMQVIGPSGIREGTLPLTASQLHLSAQALCGHSLARHEQSLLHGFISLPGGHRMGICGERKKDGLICFSSLCVRIAHEIKGAAGAVFPAIRRKSVLLLGPPGSGKTTLLRDIIRHTAQDTQVALADSRGEIAACFQGQPQLDVGPFCDVMTGGEKGQVMMMMLRSMNPQMIATDELGSPADAAAVLDMQRCGVRVIATAHAPTPEAARARPYLGPLLESRVFSHLILLEKPETPPRLLPL